LCCFAQKWAGLVVRPMESFPFLGMAFLILRLMLNHYKNLLSCKIVKLKPINRTHYFHKFIFCIFENPKQWVFGKRI